MKTTAIQQSIIRVLTDHGGTGGMTASQIGALLAYDVQEMTDLDRTASDHAVRVACERMAKSGLLLRMNQTSRIQCRYELAKERYEFVLAKPEGKPEHYAVIRDDIYVISKGMTEAEARTCVTALNDLDRRARALRQGGK